MVKKRRKAWGFDPVQGNIGAVSLNKDCGHGQLCRWHVWRRHLSKAWKTDFPGRCIWQIPSWHIQERRPANQKKKKEKKVLLIEKVIFVEQQMFVGCAKSRQCASLPEKKQVRNQETLRGDGKKHAPLKMTGLWIIQSMFSHGSSPYWDIYSCANLLGFCRKTNAKIVLQLSFLLLSFFLFFIYLLCQHVSNLWTGALSRAHIFLSRHLTKVNAGQVNWLLVGTLPAAVP